MPTKETEIEQAVKGNNAPEIIRALQAVQSAPSGGSLTAIMGLFDHPSFAVREATVRIMGEYAVAKALPAIIEKSDYRKEKDRHVRQRAVRALAAFRGPKVVAALRSALGDPALNVRGDAQSLLDSLAAESRNS